MSAEPLPQMDSEEAIARDYVDSLVSRFNDGSFIFVDYKGKTYPGIAKLLNLRGRPDLSIVRVDKINPPAPAYIVDIVLRKRPGVVKLKVDDSMEYVRRLYAKLKDNKLERLSVEEDRLAQSADAI